MRIAIIGSGGVGGFFGAKLAKGGADVTFLARGAHLEAIRTSGIAIESGAEVERVFPVRATDNPDELEVSDFVLLAVKLWDTGAMLDRIRGAVGPDTTIISFQNGVLKDTYLRERFKPSQLMGGVAYVATTIDRPGVIRQTGPLQRFLFGEFDGKPSLRSQAFLQACLAGGIKAELSPNIERDIWEKYVFLVGLSGTTASMDSPIGPIRSNAQTRQFLLDVMREVVAVGRARGIDLPVDYAERRLKLADDVSPAMTSSLHHDLRRGNRLEVAWLSGGVVTMGEQSGVPTPLNRAIHDILALRANGSSKSMT
jgi:2-dehydropantoate 2-reductase